MLRYQSRRYRFMRRLYPTVWLTNAQMLGRDLDLAKTENEFTWVDAKLLETLVQGRRDAQNAAFRFQTTSAAISGYLAFGALSIDVEVSILGFRLVQTTGVAELLLLASSMIFVLSLAPSTNALLLERLTKTVLDKLYSGPEHYLRTRATLFDALPDRYQGFYDIFTTSRPITYRWQMASSALLLLAMAVFLMMFAYLRLVIFQHVWVTSTLPGFWSEAIVLFVAVMDVASFSFALLMVLPAPHQDNAVTQHLAIMAEIDPAEREKDRELLHKPLWDEERWMRANGYLK